MQKLIIVILFISLYSCGTSDDGNTVLPNVPVNETVFLNTTVSLQAVGGSAIISGGISGIIIYRFSTDQFLAWDRACPHLPPNQCAAMTFDGLLMLCSCDNSRFSILDGSPQNDTPFAARQYRVIKNGETLIITNF
jgi:nitrite reductase/ring-hydroxylating ferredoxin subunit